MRRLREKAFEKRFQVPYDLPEDLVGSFSGIDDPICIAPPSGQLEVGLANAFMESERLALHSILRPRPPADAGEPGLGGQVKQDGGIGPEIAGSLRIQRLHSFRTQLPSSALIGHRGIAVAVADDDQTTPERGLNDFLNVGAPGGFQEEEFSQSIDAGAGRAEQQIAQRLSEGGPAGFAGNQEWPVRLGEHSREPTDLGALSAALDPLEDDKR